MMRFTMCFGRVDTPRVLRKRYRANGSGTIPWCGTNAMGHSFGGSGTMWGGGEMICAQWYCWYTGGGE